MFENGILTMKNYGERRNCTVSIIYPSKIEGLNVDVGVTAERREVEAETGLTDKVVAKEHFLRNEPYHEKTCFCHMRTTKTQISLCIRAV